MDDQSTPATTFPTSVKVQSVRLAGRFVGYGLEISREESDTFVRVVDL